MPGGAPHAGAERRGPTPRGRGRAALPVLAVRSGAVRRHPSGRPRRTDPALQVRGGGAGGGGPPHRSGRGAAALCANPAAAALAAGGTGLPRARVAAPRPRGWRDAPGSAAAGSAAAGGRTATDREPRARAGDAGAAAHARCVRGLGGAPRHRRRFGGAGARAVPARGGRPALGGAGESRARAGSPLRRVLSRRSGARRPRAAPRRRWASKGSGGCSARETQALAA